MYTWCKSNNKSVVLSRTSAIVANMSIFSAKSIISRNLFNKFFFSSCFWLLILLFHKEYKCHIIWRKVYDVNNDKHAVDDDNDDDVDDGIYIYIMAVMLVFSVQIRSISALTHTCELNDIKILRARHPFQSTPKRRRKNQSSHTTISTIIKGKSHIRYVLKLSR